MKLYLASFFQEENHGPGRKIGISPGKPPGVDCDSKFESLSPGNLYWDYQKYKKDDPELAGRLFEERFKEQLLSFVKDVTEEAAKTNKSVFEILPFQEGDTLLSWENKGNMTYRISVADILRQLGYEVVEN